MTVHVEMRKVKQV